MVNGIANTIYKSAQPNNLGPIREESDVKPSTKNTQNASVRNRNTTPVQDNLVAIAPPQEKTGKTGRSLEKQSSVTASDIQQQKLESQSLKEQKTREEKQSQKNQPITAASQSQQVEPVSDRQEVSANKTISGSKRDVPKFSITGNSDESDVESPSPKAKFYM